MIFLKILVLENGTYGKRLAAISKRTGTKTKVISFPEGEIINTDVVEKFLSENHVSSVCCTHCETSTGVINPIEKIANTIKKANKGKLNKQCRKNHF